MLAAGLDDSIHRRVGTIQRGGRGGTRTLSVAPARLISYERFPVGRFRTHRMERSRGDIAECVDGATGAKERERGEDEDTTVTFPPPRSISFFARPPSQLRIRT